MTVVWMIADNRRTVASKSGYFWFWRLDLQSWIAILWMAQLRREPIKQRSVEAAV
jgi:hypothetical protein